MDDEPLRDEVAGALHLDVPGGDHLGFGGVAHPHAADLNALGQLDLRPAHPPEVAQRRGWLAAGGGPQFRAHQADQPRIGREVQPVRSPGRGLVVEDADPPLAVELGGEPGRDPQAGEDGTDAFEQIAVGGLDREAPPARGRAPVGVEVPGHERQPLRLGQVEHPVRNPLAQSPGGEPVVFEQVGQIDAVPRHRDLIPPLGWHRAGHDPSHDLNEATPGPVAARNREHDLGPAAAARA